MGSISTPKQRRPVFSAAISVEPEPRKGVEEALSH
jgi:hypothetical protein